MKSIQLLKVGQEVKLKKNWVTISEVFNDNTQGFNAEFKIDGRLSRKSIFSMHDITVIKVCDVPCFSDPEALELFKRRFACSDIIISEKDKMSFTGCIKFALLKSSGVELKPWFDVSEKALSNYIETGLDANLIVTKINGNITVITRDELISHGLEETCLYNIAKEEGAVNWSDSRL